MKSLADRVAVVAGASRGAGRGIACALGDAGAIVYVVGRSSRGDAAASPTRLGTIEDTAEEVSRRGGHGVAVKADCTSAEAVRVLFERVAGEHVADLAAEYGFTDLDGRLVPRFNPFG
jgi:NAD(P)-dependent dehydrogenase (short-subunit alcohol dehydrogenase family)